MECSLTVVGDGVVGKTCLLMRYAHDKVPLPHEYVPTVFENYSSDIEVDGRDINLKLFDTAGQEEYARLRVLAYNKTNVFLLCYDVTELDTQKNCASWMKELRQYSKAPVILVGTKSDLLDTSFHKDHAVRVGEKLMKEIKANRFFLTSSVNGLNIYEAIEEAARLSIKKPKKCAII